jgi:hypothetical protein
MVQPVLLDTKTLAAIDNYRTEDTANELSFPKIFSGTSAATDIQMTKIGDIYIKTDTSTVYIAKGVTKATDWVEVSN